MSGALARDAEGGFWTLTLWKDLATMRAYRNTGAHRRAMPKLIGWCDEASVAHWEQEAVALPSGEEAHEKMRGSGRMSKVRHPSPAHSAMQTAPNAQPPRLLKTILLVMAVTLGCVAAPRIGAGAETPAVHRLAWLQGCWLRESGSLVTEEHWMAPRAGTMIGMSRTTRGDRTVEWEHLRIESRGDSLLYIATPSGQRETAFHATLTSDSAATFENPAHDFPQRIHYRRIGADSLLARIDGMRQGQARAIDLNFRRTTCP